MKVFNLERGQITKTPSVDTSDPQLAHATWFWDVAGNVGFLETYIPPRNTHGGILITSEIEEYDTFGTWWVAENNAIVAEGKVRCLKGRWEDDRSPQIRAERVICYGV